MRRPLGGEVQVTVLTLWTSMAAVREFAGADETVAVVEPEPRFLTAFDSHAEHFELALRAES